ncbi:MAG: Stp1/IreP family PP2C-type Ser/Thr phosphatase [Hylemonella sp.]|nr:Stp1/IreP family PP2C-type Ser/Thr phosphatase [Hylemonella sp.]
MYRFCAQTDSGLMRENNEDAFTFEEATGVAVLADGMGGYNAGEVASGMATSIINSEMSRWLTASAATASVQDIRRALEICVGNANAAVFKAAHANVSYSGMGTTLVAGVFRGSDLVIGHIGDSRCYRLRQGALVQITRDHSLLQEQIDAGLLTPEQAALSINKNLVTRALGVDDAVLLEVHEHAVEPGDVYLMCSDGLSDMVKDQDIEKTLQMPLSPEQQARALVDAANAHGGRDNITVLLVHAEAGAEKRGLMARLLGK